MTTINKTTQELIAETISIVSAKKEISKMQEFVLSYQILETRKELKTGLIVGLPTVSKNISFGRYEGQETENNFDTIEKAELAIKYFRNYLLMFSNTSCSEIVKNKFYKTGQNTDGRIDTYFEIVMTKNKI
jgi:hypothetical protein